MARKYTPKGGAGGKRPGAGRPFGATSVLARGEVAAVKAMGLRVPESAPPEHRAIADEAFETIVKVMRGEIYDPQAATVRRNAAKDIREEICGAIKQRVEHSGLDGLTDEQLEAKARAATERLAQFSGGAGTTAVGAAPGASLGPDGDVSE